MSDRSPDCRRGDGAKMFVQPGAILFGDLGSSDSQSVPKSLKERARNRSIVPRPRKDIETGLAAERRRDEKPIVRRGQGRWTIVVRNQHGLRVGIAE